MIRPHLIRDDVVREVWTSAGAAAARPKLWPGLDPFHLLQHAQRVQQLVSRYSYLLVGLVTDHPCNICSICSSNRARSWTACIRRTLKPAYSACMHAQQAVVANEQHENQAASLQLASRQFTKHKSTAIDHPCSKLSSFSLWAYTTSLMAHHTIHVQHCFPDFLLAFHTANGDAQFNRLQ